MSKSPEVSVLICTYNRASSLGRTLESVLAQKFSQPLTWEVVIVDNNSTDGTRHVVEEFQSRYKGIIRYVFEPKQGISSARNAAILTAQGELLAFIDDDEIAEQEWLHHLIANLRNKEWAGAGGRVLPPLDFEAPVWLSTKSWYASGPVPSFDKGLEAIELEEPPFGANMAFRKEVFTKCGLFRTDLGRLGKTLISNEDTEFGRRVFAAGLRLRYEPLALTYHPVEKDRLRKEYFLNWWFNKGRSDIRESGNPPGTLHICGISFRIVRAIIMETARWLFSINPSGRFGHRLSVWNSVGQLVESYQRWKSGPRRMETSKVSMD
jgi:glucosyl-dolichyl phosphate glucuronosyltransferase